MIENGKIYKYTNLINNKIYIGQTKQSLENRHKRHLTQLDDNTYFHRAIKKYGISNFKMELVEDKIPFKDLDTREKFWIKYYDSFYTTGKGYNLTEGGQWGSGTQILTTRQADEIKYLISNSDKTFVEIAKKYNVSVSCISDINTGRSFNEENLSYPLRQAPVKSEINESNLYNIIHMLKNTKITFNEIARINRVKPYTIGIINRGIYSQCPKNETYPLRKTEQKFTANNTITKQDVIQICYEICFTNKTLVEIGKQFGIAKNTIGDISRGITWKPITQQFICPIRKNKIENQKIYQSIYGIV